MKFATLLVQLMLASLMLVTFRTQETSAVPAVLYDDDYYYSRSGRFYRRPRYYRRRYIRGVDQPSELNYQPQFSLDDAQP